MHFSPLWKGQLPGGYCVFGFATFHLLCYETEANLTRYYNDIMEKWTYHVDWCVQYLMEMYIAASLGSKEQNIIKDVCKAMF